MRFPTEFVGDYRGHSAAGEFRDPDDPERVIEYGQGLKFEVDLPDGDVELVVIRINNLDPVAKFDASKLVKGERVRIAGVVTSGGWGAKLVVLSAEKEPAETPAKVGAGASS